jgi:hypothetical protein
MRMNSSNASGFVLFGLAMGLLPAIAPDLFPRNGIDGSSARALWAQTMGVVQVAIGVFYLVREGFLPWLAQWLERSPAQPDWRQQPVPANAVPVAAGAAGLQQGALFAARGLEADGVVTLRGKHAALWRALKVALLDEERLVHFLQRFRLLAHRDRNRAHAHGPAPVIVGHDAEHALIHLIQAHGIDLEQLERRSRDWLGNVSAGAFLSEIPDEVDEVVGNARRAA